MTPRSTWWKPRFLSQLAQLTGRFGGRIFLFGGITNASPSPRSRYFQSPASRHAIGYARTRHTAAAKSVPATSHSNSHRHQLTPCRHADPPHARPRRTPARRHGERVGFRDAVDTAKTAASEQASRDVYREGYDDSVEQETNQSVHGCQPAQLPRRDLYVRHLKCHSYH
jgi:hypothetical protein